MSANPAVPLDADPRVRVTAVLPDPPLLEGGAAGRCAAALLRGLQMRGVSVTAVAARRHSYLDDALPDDLDVDVVPVEPGGTWSSRADILVRPRGQLSRGAFATRVRELAEQADVLHLDQVDAGWCDVDVKTPSVVHVHYLARRDSSLRLSWDHAATLLVRELSERATVRRHHFLIANSPMVADDLRRMRPSADVSVVPLCLEPTHYSRAPLNGPPTAVFIGTGPWPTTAASLRRLVSRVWPLVHAAVPEARLVIAGRGTDRLGITNGDGITVLGEIPSAAAFFSDASVLVVPLDRGSGMKVKVLEALASGVPTVTTPAGAEGVERGDGIVVCDRGDDESVARATASILRDDLERRQRGDAARALFERNYVPEVVAEPLVDLYIRMASNGAG